MAQKPPARGFRTAKPSGSKRSSAGAPKAGPKTALKLTSEPDARPARSPRARPEARPTPKRPSEGRPASKRPTSGPARPAAKRTDAAEPRTSSRLSAADEGMIISKRPSASAGKPAAKRPAASGARPGSRRPAPGEGRPAGKRPAPGTARPAAKRPEPAEPKPAPKRPAPRKPASRGGGEGERLHKILAHAGIASRRACEELILEGRVQVNGVTVEELGTKAHPYRDQITVDFVPIHKEAPVYLLMNKPKGYVTTVKDDEGRPTVMALLQGIAERVYPVGRLDFQSEGLLLLTNDGELAHRLTGPDFHIPKVYLVKVHRMPPPELLKEFREGFRLDGRRLKPCGIEVMDKQGNPWLKVTLTEGKNQQIRRMFAAVGHPVHKLRRIQFGPLDDPSLKPGAWRPLTAQEIAALKAL